jgi:hypothetical protein
MPPAQFTNLARTEQRTAVKLGLDTIIAGNTISTPKGTYTYLTTLIRYADPPKSPENQPEYPFVNIDFGPETHINAGDVQEGENQAALHCIYTLFLDVYYKENDDPFLEAERILADLQVYFGVNYMLPNSDDDHTVHRIVYAGSEQFGASENKPLYVIRTEWAVDYRLSLVNPRLIV